VSERWWKPSPSRGEKDKKEVHQNPEQYLEYKGRCRPKSGRGIA
jgi:hypothetical protein